VISGAFLKADMLKGKIAVIDGASGGNEWEGVRGYFKK
jgi:hypothetical protein